MHGTGRQIVRSFNRELIRFAHFHRSGHVEDEIRLRHKEDIVLPITELESRIFITFFICWDSQKCCQQTFIHRGNKVVNV